MRQKSRINNWVKDGDANTKYFHAMVNYKRKFNAFFGLNRNGVWVDDPTQVKQGVKQFFEDMFKSVDWARPEPFQILVGGYSFSIEI